MIGDAEARTEYRVEVIPLAVVWDTGMMATKPSSPTHDTTQSVSPSFVALGWTRRRGARGR